MAVSSGEHLIFCLFRITARWLSYSKAVYNNTPYNKNKELLSEGAEGNPIPKKVGDKSPIKHIFYIIKENRTYDQVLGDMT